MPVGKVRAHLLKHFDRNRDKHISLADGPVVNGAYGTLDFPIDSETGRRSLRLRIMNGSLYLRDVTTLF